MTRPVNWRVYLFIFLPEYASRCLFRWVHTFEQSCWQETNAHEGRSPRRLLHGRSECELFGLRWPFVKEKWLPHAHANNCICGPSAALMAPQRATVCFPAESFLFFPFSLQLLPLCPSLPKWVRQQAGTRRDRLGRLTACLSVFSPNWPCCWSCTRADCKTEAPLWTEHVHESQNSSVLRWSVFWNENITPAPVHASAPALNYMFENQCSVILTAFLEIHFRTSCH